MKIEDALAKARDYVLGVHRQDAGLLRTTFDETAHIVGLDEGKKITVPRDRWIEFVCAPERAGWGAADYEIASVEVIGTVAAVVVGTRYGRFRYQDVLTMVDQPGGNPVIAAKTFHQLT